MIKTLAGSLRQHKKGSIITVCLSILEAAFEIIIPLCMSNLIDYDIADGKIRYDGININKIKKADLRRSLGVVCRM